MNAYIDNKTLLKNLSLVKGKTNNSSITITIVTSSIIIIIIGTAYYRENKKLKELNENLNQIIKNLTAEIEKMKVANLSEENTEQRQIENNSDLKQDRNKNFL